MRQYTRSKNLICAAQLSYHFHNSEIPLDKYSRCCVRKDEVVILTRKFSIAPVVWVTCIGIGDPFLVCGLCGSYLNETYGENTFEFKSI